jgi:predicted nucleic acid-binding protein
MILTLENEWSAVLDSCVLIPMPLCDTLLRLAEEPALYRPLWSEQILAEVSTVLESKFKCNKEQCEKRISRMRAAFPEAVIDIAGDFVKGLTGFPDENDCHVVAAAILGHANAIITSNTKHFPRECLEKYNVLCHHPDDFLIHQYSLDRDRVLSQLDAQAANIRQDRTQLLKELTKAVPKFVDLVVGKTKVVERKA